MTPKWAWSQTSYREILLILISTIKTKKNKTARKEQRINNTEVINKTRLQTNYIHITMKEAY